MPVPVAYPELVPYPVKVSDDSYLEDEDAHESKRLEDVDEEPHPEASIISTKSAKRKAQYYIIPRVKTSKPSQSKTKASKSAGKGKTVKYKIIIRQKKKGKEK